MGKLVVSQNVSLDGVVEDPSGEQGFRHGGWFVQFIGQDWEASAALELAEAQGAEALLLGRRAPDRARLCGSLLPATSVTALARDPSRRT